MRRLRPLAPFLAVLFACGEPTGPAAFAGSYGLVGVDGHSPPALIGATIYCDVMLPDALLTVSNSTFGLSMDIVEDCRRSGGDSTVVPAATAGAISVSGDTLILADTDGASVTYLKATRAGSELVLVMPPDNAFFFFTDHALQFERQPFINRHF